MAQKMTLSAYLAQRGKKAKALTKGEAALLGVPFPLQAGWPRRYGAVEIDEAMLEQLEACAEAARRAAEEKSRRAEAKHAAGPLPRSFPPPALMEPVVSRVVSGFVLRKARRYRERTSASWS